MDRATLIVQVAALSYINANRDTDAFPEPVDLDWPWPPEEPVRPNADVTADERAELRRQLDAASVWR